VDLSQIDFEALKERFEKGRKRTEAEKLRGQLNAKLKQMVRLNKSRTDYLEKFQRMIEEYNAGSINVQLFFDELMRFAKDLTEEEQRSISERLSEEELAVFDLLTKPEMSLTEKEKDEVKKVARELLTILKKEKLVLEWRKRQQARAAVRVTVEEVLEELPPTYTDEMYWRKCNAVYQHIYDHYYGSGRSVYAEAS
jgi:type I restriction enzyme, R subunit